MNHTTECPVCLKQADYLHLRLHHKNLSATQEAQLAEARAKVCVTIRPEAECTFPHSDGIMP